MPQASRLFTATSWVVRIATFLALALVAVLVLAVGAVLLAVLGVFTIPLPAAVTGGLPIQEVLAAGAMAIMACVIIVTLAALVLILVGRIVDSAIAGDPFVIKNANRLNVIGGLLLGIQAVGLVTGMVISAFPRQISDHLQIGFDLSLTGLFTAMLVFVLAQIFRHGAEMRAELEGTI